MRRPNDFSDATKRQLAARVGHMCSYVGCYLSTSAPAQGQPGALNLGRACHIVGAGENGPRPNSQYGLTDEQLRSPDNGIWMCVKHADLIDSDQHAHQVDLLRLWKRQAEDSAANRAHYGHTPAFNVGPNVVGPPALEFARQLRAVIPPHPLRFMRDIRADHLRSIEDFLRTLYPFQTSHPLHGVDPDLLEEQLQVIDDLKAFMNFVQNSGHYWFDPGTGTYRAIDRREPCPTLDIGDALLSRLDALEQSIRVQWGKGQRYYRRR